MMKYVILYLSGFIITWILCKILRGKDEHCNGWDDVVHTMGFSAMSWIGFFVIIILGFGYMLKEKFREKINPGHRLI